MKDKSTTKYFEQVVKVARQSPCKKAGNDIEGSTLYFMRIDDKAHFTDADEPFCLLGY